MALRKQKQGKVRDHPEEKNQPCQYADVRPDAKLDAVPVQHVLAGQYWADGPIRSELAWTLRQRQIAADNILSLQ